MQGLDRASHNVIDQLLIWLLLKMQQLANKQLY